MHQTGNERACGAHDQPHAEIRRVRRFDPIAFEAAVRALLEASGIEIDSAHTGRTAQRVRELWQRRLLDGYEVDPAQALGAGFDDPREDMVIVRSIAVHGVCPHHLLPFRGVAHVAYLPGGRLHGFGRIARMIDAISHRYTYQEWITHRIATALVTHGQARGAACLIEAEQLCLLMGENRRGDERVITQCYAGEFERDVQARNEFLRGIHRLGDAGGAPRPAFAGCGRGPADAARGSRLASFAGGGVRGVRAAARVRGRSTGSFGRSAERAKRAARIAREVRRAVRAL
ncbi:GTP cyclohydrolase I family protein [Burkholderia pseudomallei MSHR3951]|nr:GTP cyclohydrolase I family protein [Burkholderia pseudomallei MSHR3951]